MANETIYMTIITALSGFSSLTASAALMLQMNFIKSTGAKFKSLFDRMGEEEKERAVRDERFKGQIERHDNELERLGERCYKVSDKQAETGGRINKVERRVDRLEDKLNVHENHTS